MLKLKSKNFTFEAGNTEVKVFFTAFSNEKDKNARGFADVSVWTKDVKYPQQFNNLKLVEGKDENLFLVEPTQNKSYQDKDGVKRYKSIYVMKREVKADLAARIAKEAVEK